MSEAKAQWLKVGQISGVHGVRGWVKVYSYTDPRENIVGYRPWRIEQGGVSKSLDPLEAKYSGKALIVALAGISDRDQALALRHSDIWIAADQLPPLTDEYYWHQLQGLKVVSLFNGKTAVLGRVGRLLETGANDVLVVKGNDDSIDRRERLIPYLPGQTISAVDLDAGEIRVDWDPTY